MSNTLNAKPVTVFAPDRTTVRGVVHAGTTSIGAAKVAGTDTAVKSYVNGKLCWVGKAYR